MSLYSLHVKGKNFFLRFFSLGQTQSLCRLINIKTLEFAYLFGVNLIKKIATKNNLFNFLFSFLSLIARKIVCSFSPWKNARNLFFSCFESHEDELDDTLDYALSF
jgi:hypothetical protein